MYISMYVLVNLMLINEYSISQKLNYAEQWNQDINFVYNFKRKLKISYLGCSSCLISGYNEKKDRAINQ